MQDAEAKYRLGLGDRVRKLRSYVRGKTVNMGREHLDLLLNFTFQGVRLLDGQWTYLWPQG